MSKLRKIATANKQIYNDGFYINKNSNKVELSDAIEYSIKNSELLEDISISSVALNNNSYRVKDNIIHAGTIDCILDLRANGETGNIIALNFASATRPGG